MQRTHNCGELRAKDISKKVMLSGWISSRRDHGEIIFIDLRDKQGITQIVFDPDRNRQIHEKAHLLRDEYCVGIEGTVASRPEGTINPKIATGEIEVEADGIEIFSESKTPPFEIKDDISISEDVRLKYRYLDLRRRSMQKKIYMKHKAYKYITDFLDREGFVSVETPILTKSTPEGARDYLVPSRTMPGNFYALPQSPQIFKQLLMVAGVEKYFQIARCFRDEDLRKDRQPEFTQLDIEMSFIKQDDILEICEGLFKGLFKEILGEDIKLPFSRISYEEAMDKYGTDKPDARFEVFLCDFSRDIECAGCGFKVFHDVLLSGGKIKGLAAPGYASISRREIDELTAFVSKYGAKGLAYFKVEEKGLSSPIAKFFAHEMLESFREKTGAKPGDMIFMVADSCETVCCALSMLRLKIGQDKKLIKEDRFDFLWVLDFPLFKYDRDEKRWVSEHHPFTSFREEDIEFLEKGELSKVKSRSYDLVLNGNEIGSGSIRIHKRDIQQKIFDVLGMTNEESEQKFGFLLEAFQYGPPPHGGIAFGMDRLVALFTNDSSIREVIAFPKTQKGTCPLTGAPSGVDSGQLKELGIKVRVM